MTKENLGSYLILIIALILLFSFTGPEQQDEFRQPEANAKILMQQPVTFQAFETAAQALPTWRQFAEDKPAILLLSNHPFLMPLNQETRGQTLDLAEQGSTEELFTASDHRRSDFLFISGMALEIARQKDWFSELYWALPLQDQEEPVLIEEFEKNLNEAGITTEKDAASLKIENSLITGTLRQTNFFAAKLEDLPQINQNVVVHIDLSYFEAVYKNEITSPLFTMIFSTLKKLADKNLKVLAVTFSYGHLDDHIALDVRFIGEIFKDMIGNPQIFSQPLPQNWLRQGNALYLNNFFQKEEIRELYEAQQKEAPNSAWVKFNLYRSAAEFKQGNLALEYLAKAVALDAIYALEYFDLAELAYTRGRPDEAIRMLNLGLEIFPDNVKRQLRHAEISAEVGEIKTALHIISQLKKQSWSHIYYPEMPEALDQLEAMLNESSKEKP